VPSAARPQNRSIKPTAEPPTATNRLQIFAPKLSKEWGPPQAALIGRLNLDSSNSSKPPSTDPHRERRAQSRSPRPQGGQTGHVGSTLQQVADPDQVRVLHVRSLSTKLSPPP